MIGINIDCQEQCITEENDEPCWLLGPDACQDCPFNKAATQD